MNTSYMYPMISIVTPSLNQGQYIVSCIESILKQDYPRFEHIVIDGGSTDNTLEVLDRYPHLRWVSEPDKGQSQAINKGLRMTRGQIIAYLNSDDFYYPGTFFKVNQSIDVAKGKYVVNGNGVILDRDEKPYLFLRSKYMSPGAILDYSKGFSVFQPSTFIAREVIDHIGYLNEDEHLVMDVEWFVRINENYPFWPIDGTLAALRFHGGSKTFTQGMRLNHNRSLLSVDEVKRVMVPYWKKKGRWCYAWYLYQYHWGRWMILLNHYLEWRRKDLKQILKYFFLCIITKPYIIVTFWLPHWIGAFIWGYRRQIDIETKIRRIFSHKG